MPLCQTPGCVKETIARGLCKICHQRLMRSGAPRIYNPRGAGSINSDGYHVVTANGKAVLEHRLIMSRIIGRDLLSNEIVHHINENKLDNRPENLELMLNTEHLSLHHTRPENTGKQKYCPRCTTVKHLDTFSYASASRQNRASYCKPCAAEVSYEHAQRNK